MCSCFFIDTANNILHYGRFSLSALKPIALRFELATAAAVCCLGENCLLARSAAVLRFRFACFEPLSPSLCLTSLLGSAIHFVLCCAAGSPHSLSLSQWRRSRTRSRSAASGSTSVLSLRCLLSRDCLLCPCVVACLCNTLGCLCLRDAGWRAAFTFCLHAACRLRSSPSSALGCLR